MTKIFYYKILVLFFIASGFSIFVLSVSLSPSYFLSRTKVSFIHTKLETQKKEAVPVPDRQTVADIASLDKKLQVIEKTENTSFIISEKVINSIIRKKTFEIKISKISYQTDSIKGKNIIVGGTSPSREVLLLFRKALEDDPTFKNVDLPISNFVKGSDINFSLTLTPA